MKTTKDMVNLKERVLDSGVKSLYLDYSVNGIRKRKSLKMFILPGNDPITRQKNIATMKMARLEQSRVLLELQCALSPLQLKRTSSSKVKEVYDSFLKYKKEIEDVSPKRYIALKSVLSHWLTYAGENVTLDQIDKDMIIGFQQWLKRKKYKPNTVFYYMTGCLSNFFTYCVKKGLMAKNPLDMFMTNEKPHFVSVEKPFLTFEEVQMLMQTPCKSESLKNAFLFCCFTGLRWSDVSTLKWGMIKGGYINKVLQKTSKKNQEVKHIPISENAKKFIPHTNKMAQNANVFDLPKYYNIPALLSDWGERAGLDKHLTFHVSRHTCATLLLTYGADLYTVSKILGHSDIQVTQVYAKVIDLKKTQAVSLVPEV